jgi:small ligand-binding sensory domain FIST
MIRAAVGVSTERNTARAALEAAGQVVEAFDGSGADWCIAFVSGEHRDHLAALTDSLSGALDTPYIAGCSAAGVMVGGREYESGPVLGVLAVGSDQLLATPFMFHDEGDQGSTAGVRLGQRLAGSRGSEDLLLVWPDPFNVRPDRLLQSVDAVLGPVPVVGGAASVSLPDASTFQFCGPECGEASVSGIRLGGRFRHVIGVTQGCRPLGGPLRVTGAHENLLLEIEGRPALEVLRECAPAGSLDEMDWGLQFLFVGLLPDPDAPRVESGEYLVRNIVTADPDTGVLAIADTVEEGQHIVFVVREPAAARQDLAAMLEQVSDRRTGLDYRFGLYFNCLARGRSLYQEGGIDSALLAEALPGVPLLGFFCNAEIGPIRGQNRLFTYTGMLLLVAE